MKKSKLLIPAVAFLVVSMAAAATSTVAWFTANTAVSASVSNIIAASSDGSLYIDSAYNANEGCGATLKEYDSKTDLSAATKTTADNIALSELRDASFDVNNAKASYINKNADGSLGTTYADVAAPKDPNSKYYFYATFKLRFVVKTTDESQKYDIFLSSGSALTLAGSYANHIDSAVRIGMITGSKKNVWAPNYDTTDTDPLAKKNSATEISYVSNTGAAIAESTYTYTEAAGSSVSYKTGTNITTFDATPSYSAQSNYLGRINSFASGYGSLETTFYIWFEGRDVFCINDNVQTSAQAFSLSLQFNSIKGLAA